MSEVLPVALRLPPPQPSLGQLLIPKWRSALARSRSEDRGRGRGEKEGENEEFFHRVSGF